MVLDKFSLEGQVGIVTGGGAGLGRAYVRACAQAGAAIAIAEIDPETGPAMVAQLEAEGHRGLFVHTDVTQRESVGAMVEQVLAEFGQIDFLINNAGAWTFGPAEGVSEENWRKIVALDVDTEDHHDSILQPSQTHPSRARCDTDTFDCRPGGQSRSPPGPCIPPRTPHRGGSRHKSRGG